MTSFSPSRGLHLITLECPNCGQKTLALKPQDGLRLIAPLGFHVENRDGEQAIVCQCGGVLYPPRSSN